MIVVSDTTPIISLMKADRLDLLYKLYHQVIVPKAVYEELINNEHFSDEAKKVQQCPFIVVQKVRNLQAISILRNVTGLDAGESEALILYGEQCADLLLMDENKGRKVAKQMDIKHIGTVGVLLEAYAREILKPNEIAICLDTMLDSDIRLSKELCNMVLEYVGLPQKY